MPTVTKPKRRNPAALASDPMTKVRPILDECLEIVRRGEFLQLGTIRTIQTVHGAMRFPDGTGPAVGFVQKDGVPVRTVLVITSAWEGLPAVRVVTNEPCQACLRDCDVCDKQGRKACEGQGCREKRQCDMCHDTRFIDCPQCRGTKKYPTGIVKGGSDYKDGKCPNCNGLRFQGRETPQDLKRFVNPESDLGPMTVLGPIVAMIVDNFPGSQHPQTIFDVDRDLNGDFMVLLLEPTPAVNRAYLLGGVLKEKRR